MTVETAKLWNIWLEDLRHAEQLRIPPHYSESINKLQKVQLHVFCDASIEAFAAVAYFGLEDKGNICTTLVMAKTRVAPIKILTVPRLELQSAVMAIRLAAFIQREHNIQIDRVVFWSVSQTALSWIKSDARKYQSYVAHRIAEILDNTSPTDWRWIPTDLNVADEATRSKKQETLENSSRHRTGDSMRRKLCVKTISTRILRRRFCAFRIRKECRFYIKHLRKRTDQYGRPSYQKGREGFSTSDFRWEKSYCEVINSTLSQQSRTQWTREARK